MKPITMRTKMTQKPFGATKTQHSKSKIGSRAVDAPRSILERELTAELLDRLLLRSAERPSTSLLQLGGVASTVLNQLSAPPGSPAAPPSPSPSPDDQQPCDATQMDYTVDQDTALAGIGLTLPPALQSMINSVPPRIRGLVACNLLVLLVATNWVVVKEAGDAFDPFLFAALRFGVAAAALLPFLAKAVRNPTTLRAGVELGVLTAIGYLAQSEGLLTTDASRASFLSTFTVIVVPLLAGMSGQGVRQMTWAASAAALVGVALLENSGAPPCVGDVWSFISAVAFGFQIFRTEHWTRILGQRDGIPLISIVLATTATIAAAAAGYTHPDAFNQIMQMPHNVADAAGVAMTAASHVPWIEVLYTGLLTTDVALLMELAALRDVNSTEVAIIYTLEPVLGAAFAFAAFGERWSASGWVGATLIVASCLGMQIFGSEEEGSSEGKVTET